MKNNLIKRTRIKVCGITRPVDGIAAADCGVDAIGLVFYSRSPRVVDLTTAKAIVATLPPFVVVVALFVNPTPEEVYAVLSYLPVDLLQFHGTETPNFCSAFSRPYLKAIPMRPETNLSLLAQDYNDARGLLVDAYRPGIPGGTGECFDWNLLPTQRSFPLVLAGGLNPGNVADAVRRVHPYAVDVSGGVEVAKGIKDPQLIAAFVQAVQYIDTPTNK
ncbi:N-(5'-phosphoribosyl)anthranilate isomerase [Gammaproteobacteria bacterium]